MSKYQPLSDRLQRHEADEYGASFAEIEEVLGFPLPKSARSGRAWWGNDADKAHSRAWAAHGWEVGDVDHAAERVVFRRGAASGAVLQQAAALQPLADAQAHAPPRPDSAGPPAILARLPTTQGAASIRSDKPPVAMLAALAGGAAVLAGLGVLAGRALLAPKRQPPFPPRRKGRRQP